MPYFKIVTGIIILLLIDLVSKYLFFDIGLLPQIFQSTFNTGISFSVMINQLMVEIITICFIIGIARFVGDKKIDARIGILLIAGALGNLLDRIFLGGVRDFIWLGLGPVFNIADIYITLGATYLIIFEFWGSKK